MLFLYTPSVWLISQLRSNTGNTLVSKHILAMSVLLCTKVETQQIKKYQNMVTELYTMCNWEVENTANGNTTTSYNKKIKKTELLSQIDKHKVQLRTGTSNHRHQEP